MKLYTPDYDWLVTNAYNRLHHASLSRKRAKACEDDGGIYDEPVTFDCGVNTKTALVPGVVSRGGFGGGLPRCKECCEATGLPEGNGSPKNDAECRRLLGLDS